MYRRGVVVFVRRRLPDGNIGLRRDLNATSFSVDGPVLAGPLAGALVWFVGSAVLPNLDLAAGL